MAHGKIKISGTIQERYNAISGKQEPKNFKMSRNVILQSSNFERSLFDTDTMEEKGEMSFTLGRITRQITERDLYSSIFALSQIFSNQSYKSGQETGLGKGTENKALSRITGVTERNGEIYFSLNEYCKLANGTDDPSTQERKAAETLLKTLDSTPSEIEYKDTKVEAYLAKTVTRVIESDGSIYYHVYLHPLFLNMSKGFASVPQDVITRLRDGVRRQKGRMTDAHYKLLALLVQQRADGGKVFTRTALEILQYLGLEQAYREQKQRTIKQLLQTFEAVRCTGVITGFKAKYIKLNGKDVFDRVDFYLNPYFTKNDAIEIIESE